MPNASKPGVALVTGASGFIGGRLRDTLLDEGWDVVALTRPASPAPKRGRAAAVDYANLESLKDVVRRERPAAIFHLAGATKGVTYSHFQDANVVPTRNLALAAREANGQLSRFVFVSSLTAYGPSTPEQPLIETHEPKPMEHYGKSKLEAERVLSDEIGDSLPWTIIRPSGVYGPGDIDFFELYRLASRGLNLFYGNRDFWFSAVHVDDVVRSILDAAHSGATIGKGYFICDGKPLTWGDYQREVVEAVGKRVLHLNLPQVTMDVAAAFGELLTRMDGKPRVFNRQKVLMGKQRAWTCRHDAARTDFGYRPKLDVREGVAHTLDWYRRQGWLR
ncbi:MAG TPA: NAD-dependent epimerase/dehydratase family protein [Polyangiales bacterium]|nr:NAD-dependent epimerase/dehydratase family protein [Polyangiales bacterium]